MKFLLLAFISTSVFAFNPYQIKPAGYSPACDSKIEVPNLPPVRDQGRYGTCYAHSSVLLIEHLRCSGKPDPQACYANKGSVLHLAAFQNYLNDQIKIGGDTRVVLTNFKDKRKLAPESCAEYDDWKNLDKHYKTERKNLNAPTLEMSEVDYFYYVSNRLKKNATEVEVNCFAQEILDAGISQNITDVKAILAKGSTLSWQELRYKILVPESCRNQSIEYPKYNLHTFPRYNDKNVTTKNYKDFVFRALKLGIPVEASFRASQYYDKDGKPAYNYHSATVVGQRHVCDRNKCELQYRIQNSYGKSWQDNFDNGWVNADHLIAQMQEPSLGFTAAIPEGKTLDTKLSAQDYSSLRNPVLTNGCWQGTPETATTSQTPSTSQVSQPVNYGEKGVWKCTKDGQTRFGEYAVQGWNCKKIQ